MFLLVYYSRIAILSFWSLVVVAAPCVASSSSCWKDKLDLNAAFITKPTGWRSAHMQCRSTGGFLVAREELLGASHWPASSSSHMEKNHNLAWTGLTFIQGRPTWLTQCPGPAFGIIWGDGSTPEFGYGECAAIDLSQGTFLTVNCDTRLPYVCIKTENRTTGVPPSKDSEVHLDLVASGEASSVSWGSKDVFSVNQKQFRTLSLTCHLKDGDTQIAGYSFWRKDGIILRNRNSSIKPSEMEDSFLDKYLQNKIKGSADAVKQGTFWCEAWQPLTHQRIVSNKILLQENQWLTFILKEKEPSHQDLENEINLYVNDLIRYIPNIYKYPFVPIVAKKDKYIDDNWEHLLHLYVPKSDIKDINYLIKHTIPKRYGNLITLPTHCLPQVITYNNLFMLEWSYAAAGEKLFPKNFKCETIDGEVLAGECKWNFTYGAYITFDPSQCREPLHVSKKTLQLWDINESPKNYKNKIKLLYKLTNDGSSLEAIDLKIVASILQSIINDHEYNFYFGDFLKTIHNIIQVNPSSMAPVQSHYNSSNKILEVFDKIVNEDKYANQMWSLPFISVHSVVISKSDLVKGFPNSPGLELNEQKKQVLYHIKGSDSNVDISLPFSVMYDLLSKVQTESKFLKLVVTTQMIDTLFQDSESFSQYKVKGPIIGIDFNAPKGILNTLPDNITIKFKGHSNNKKDFKCVFWDFQVRAGLGGWSEEGCSQGKLNNHYTACICNHLSYFAQLFIYNGEASTIEMHDIAATTKNVTLQYVEFDMKYKLSEIHQKILTNITITGMSLSIIGLSFLFITYIIFRKWRNKQSTILVNLAVAIFFSNVIFLIGIDQTDSSSLCFMTALGLHYFILVTFDWALVEGVFLYISLVKVFSVYVPTRFIYKAYIFAWGLPILPISVFLLLDYTETVTYLGSEEICWISSQVFCTSFLPHLVTVFLINIFVFVKIIEKTNFREEYLATGTSVHLSTIHDEEPISRKFTRVTCFFFLLCLTWTFGLLVINSESVVYAYLFCICNTFQGFFLFVVIMIPKKGARQFWIELAYPI